MPQDFRAILASRIDQSGKSLAAIARDAGMSRPDLSAYLAGRKAALNSTTLARLLDALGPWDLVWRK
jgi:transcriptional regulator with XRE-family HTH domain